MRAYVAISLVIYIQNGDILSKDLIINEFKCTKQWLTIIKKKRRKNHLEVVELFCSLTPFHTVRRTLMFCVYTTLLTHLAAVSWKTLGFLNSGHFPAHTSINLLFNYVCRINKRKLTNGNTEYCSYLQCNSFENILQLKKRHFLFPFI